MTAQVQNNVSRDHLLTTLSSGFGVVATLLAALGRARSCVSASSIDPVVTLRAE